MRPQMGENIGAAARVMLNFGLTDLRLVAPRDGWPNPKAVEMSANAFDQVKTKIFENFEDAVADLDFLYATTARNRDMLKEVVTPEKISVQGKTGIVFGAERTGLENYEISFCDKLVSIPVSKDFTSLNLAQSVAVIAYEIGKYKLPEKLKEDLATKQELTGLFSHLEDELTARNFFLVPEKKAGMMINIRNLFSRAELTGQEVRTLRGIIRSLCGK